MADRNPQYEFVSLDAARLESDMVAAYERITGTIAQPGSPERLFIQWVTYILLVERAHINYTGNQNIPSRAEGENLDALAELYYIRSRPEAQPAQVTVTFTISEAQNSPVLIPAGTRLTDAGRALVWETREDVYVQAEETTAETTAWCQTPGIIGNGYAPGQITTCVDQFQFFSAVTNTTESAGGSDRPDDDAFYELMRQSQDAWSTAGPIGSYQYHARKVSTDIADVVVNSPNPGEVRIYVLTDDGKTATEELKKAVLAACNADEVRPLTDKVLVEDADEVEYNIDLTYYLRSDSTASSNAIQAAVSQAVDAFVTWQARKLGRDINPSRLISDLMATGIKRVELRKPEFKALQDGWLVPGQSYELEQTVPQIAKLGTRTVTNGGFEDE